MKKLLDNYVYRNLKTYGNAYINEETYDRIGRTKILEDLKQHGFDCEIRIYKHCDEHFIESKSHVRRYVRNIILQAK